MTKSDDTYSIYVATIYVFNLIFGSGVLLLVYAFWNVGYVIGSILFIVLGFFSLVTCTYIVESMSLACAISRINSSEYSLLLNSDETKMNDDSDKKMHLADDSTKSIQLDDLTDEELFVIDNKYELMDLVKLFLPKFFQIFFSIITIIYLFGDLLVYLSVVGGSLQRITCTDFKNGFTLGIDFCEKVGHVNVFRIYISIFTVLIGGMVYFNVSKTKFVQIGTISLRWTAFLVMFVLAWIRVGHKATYDPHPFNLSYLPVFIGTGLYSFMCQHSLPGVLFPIRDKTKPYSLVFYFAVALALILYVSLTISGILAFKGDEIQQIYTMNFMIVDQGMVYIVIGSFLQLFPVVALSSSYPIIGITLRETIKNLALNRINKESRWYTFLYRFILPSIVIFLPYIFITFVSDKVSMIVGIVGSYAGAFVQYVIPAALVFVGRRKLGSIVGMSRVDRNFQRSKFSATWLIISVFIWSIVAVGLVAFFHIRKFAFNA